MLALSLICCHTQRTWLVRSHGLQTIDAIHLAVATQEVAALDPDLVLVTRDERQAAAAAAMGIAVLDL